MLRRLGSSFRDLACTSRNSTSLRTAAVSSAASKSSGTGAGSQGHEKHGGSAGSVLDALGDAAVGFLQAGSLAYVMYNYFMSTCVMVGPSMWPTFLPKGDVVLVEKLTHKWGQLLPGDIVTCTSPEDPTLSICKRVAALEGSAVAVPVSDDFRNPLTHFLGLPQYEMLEVPRGHVWLLGDNAPVSYDSRSYGPVPYALITGRVFAQVWPPARARVFARGQHQRG